MKAVLTKVELGEVDAGIVYVTDVKRPGDKVAGVPITPARTSRRRTRSPRSRGASTPRRPGVRRLVLSPAGQQSWRIRVRRAVTRRSRAVTAPPWPVAVPAALALLFLGLPLLGLLVRAPWERMWSVLTSPTSLDALRLSLVTASSATVVSFVVGVPLAWLLARATSPDDGSPARS